LIILRFDHPVAKRTLSKLLRLQEAKLSLG